MPTARRPWITPTLLKKLLAGEDSCTWRAWFIANHESGSYAEVPRGDFSQWNIEHTAMLDAIQAERQALGHSLSREGQNSFRLDGRTAGLSGKPDLIEWDGEKYIVIDAKTGRPRDSDTVQLLIYLWALPQADAKYRGVPMAAQLVYKDGPRELITLSPGFGDRVVGLIQTIVKGGMEPTPNAEDCRFCPLAKETCPVRVDAEASTAETEAF